MLFDYVCTEQVGEKGIVLFGRNGKDKYKISVNDFSPYFYAPVDERVVSGDIVEERYGKFYSLFGEKVKGIVMRSPGAVPYVRERFSKTFEADVLFPLRFRIDRKIRGGFVIDDELVDGKEFEVSFKDIKGVTEGSGRPLYKMYLDIEVAGKRFVRPSQASQPIIAIGFYFRGVYYSLVWRKDLNRSKYKTKFKGRPHYVFTYSKERELIREFVYFVDQLDPDVILGWNLLGYDIPYIVFRSENIKIDISDLSPLEIIAEDKFRGRLLLDMLDVEEKVTKKRPKLVDKCKQKGIKSPYNPKKIHYWWENDIDKLVDYNIHHVRSCVELDKIEKYFGFIYELTNIACTDLDGAYNESWLIDGFLLLHKPKWCVLPTRKKGALYKKYEGAMVLSPKKRGLVCMVIVLDVKGMYPNIFMAGNMSPETITDNPKNAVVLPNGMMFKKEPIGVMPSALKILLKYREKYRGVDELKYESIRQLNAAFYGYTAFEGARVYNPDIAASVTLVGRLLTKFIIKKVESLGYEVQYGHTDSTHIILGDVSLEEATRIGEELRDYLNKSFKNFAKKYNMASEFFRIELEKIYGSAFYGKVKNRYCGTVVWKDGKRVKPYLDIVGFEFISKSSSKMVKDMQEKFFNMVLGGKSKKTIQNYLEDLIDNVKDFDLQYLTSHKTLRKEKYKVGAIHYKAAMYSNEHLGTNFATGDSVDYIKVKDTGVYPKTNVIAIDDNIEVPYDFVIDYNAIIETDILGKVRKVFDALGWVDVVSNLDAYKKKQRTLSSFIGGF